jgi:hypothetical protein
VLPETRFAGRAVQQIYHVNFYNQKDELVAEADSWCFRTERDTAREQGTKYRHTRERAPHRYTADEIAEAYKLYRDEPVQGATPRFWEDVSENEALPVMLKGPMTVTGFIAYAQGWGGLYIRANKLAWKLIDAHPGVGITNRFGIPDVPERVHWEEDFALEVGAPGAYDYGPERASDHAREIDDAQAFERPRRPIGSGECVGVGHVREGSSTMPVPSTDSS